MRPQRGETGVEVATPRSRIPPPGDGVEEPALRGFRSSAPRAASTRNRPTGSKESTAGHALEPMTSKIVRPATGL